MRTKELHLNAQKLLEQRLAESLGLDRYAEIMTSFRSTDVSTDEAFQKNFNAFYMVRKNAGWRSIYYELFEKAKHESMAYEDILEALYERTGMVEASFASKMIATLDDQCPIIDQYVLKNLGLMIAGTGKEARLRSTIQTYYELCDWYDSYLETQEAGENIDCFNRMLPGYVWISDIKKIDYMIWSFRD